MEGLLHRAHCPLKEAIKEMIIMKYFKAFYKFPYNETGSLYYLSPTKIQIKNYTF